MRIPMMDDPPTLKQIFEKYGDPLEELARMHFDCLQRAAQQEVEGNSKEAVDFRITAEKCRMSMAKYGFLPTIIDDQARAVKQ
jgi:hypothetical protein